MGLESEWKLLEEIAQINKQAGKIEEEIDPLLREIEEMEHIHRRFANPFSGNSPDYLQKVRTFKAFPAIK